MSEQSDKDRDALRELIASYHAYESVRHTSVGETVTTARDRFFDALAEAEHICQTVPECGTTCPRCYGDGPSADCGLCNGTGTINAAWQKGYTREIATPAIPASPAAPSEGPTPRTDAIWHSYCADADPVKTWDMVRQLERELAEQTNEAKRWRQACQDSDETRSATRDRNLDGVEEFLHALIFGKPIWPNQWGQDVAAAAFFLHKERTTIRSTSGDTYKDAFAFLLAFALQQQYFEDDDKAKAIAWLEAHEAPDGLTVGEVMDRALSAIGASKP